MLGLGVRRRLQRHFALLFRLQFALGMGVLAVLAGWSFELSPRNVGALAVVLRAAHGRVRLASHLFRGRADGPLLAFGMYGNPTFWSLPVAAATLGPHAAVFIVAYDMLTQGRSRLGVKLLRMRAPVQQSARSASRTTRRPPGRWRACCSAASSRRRRRSRRWSPCSAPPWRSSAPCCSGRVAARVDRAWRRLGWRSEASHST